MRLRPVLGILSSLIVLFAPTSRATGCGVRGETLAVAGVPSALQMLVGCPLAEPPGQSKISVHVLAWCNLPGPHHQILFKLKVAISNHSSQTIAIDTSHWRMLVSQFVQGRWTPPPIHGTARPVVVHWAGRAWWAVPANLNGAAEPDPYQSPGTPTFATHWDGTYLGPGATYIRRARYHGDLVFYVPENDPRHPETNLRGDVALAYLVSTRPTVVVPSENWGPKLPGASF
jgi:hypothetical protein